MAAQPRTEAPLRQSANGTPKRGYGCPDCLDFLNQVDITHDGKGGETYTERPCHCVTDAAQEGPR